MSHAHAQAKTVAAKEKARGTLLASVRPQEVKDKDGKLIENTEVICCSYYEENKDKPFHMMSNIVEGVEVIDLTKRCYSVSTQKYFDVVIKRLSLANLYNQLMNQVDRADQLRNHLRPDGLWLRMRKWWWAFFLWGMGQSVVNAYVLYKKVCERAKQNPMTHLDFQVAVITCWCTTPKIILEPGKATAAVPFASPRGTTSGAASRTPAPAAAVGAPTAAAGTPASGGKPSMISDKRIEEAKVSYATCPELHTICMPIMGEQGGANCQMCNTKRGQTEGKRVQTPAVMRCAHCNFQVCCADCWMKLHGYGK